MAFLMFTGFVLLGLVSLLAAVTGRRGHVCDRNRGYRVPAAVAADPRLAKKANDLVAFWCTGAAFLSVPPLIPLLLRLTGDGREDFSVPVLLAIAAYGFLVVVIGRYPFEKIRRMG
ncbi:hypothetical protein CTZ27_33070 [Streptomyces griseocarneus]|nr:hypothetical protein CTZ27_33070 [Streptomyces griseocarneus]